MKYVLIITLIIITVGAYLLWPVKYENEGWISLRDDEEHPIKEEIVEVEVEKKETTVLKKKEKKQSKIGFSNQEKAEYFDNIRDIIKDQWKELEECENDFDEKFGALVKLNPIEKINYLKDPGNMEDFLDKLSKFKGTTPSSAKMIKELAMPITSELDAEEIMETVGFVKTCRDYDKTTLILLLGKFLKEDKK